MLRTVLLLWLAAQPLGPAGAQEAPPAGAGFPDLPLPPAVPAATVPVETRPKGRAFYLALVAREAARQGVPADLADAVAQIESGYDPSAIGSVGELGLMQVRPGTAALLGHKGPAADLLDPTVGARFGVAYLAGAWRLAGGDLCRALVKYRAGHGEERVSARSADYCFRARRHLAAIHSPLADAPSGSAGFPRPAPVAGAQRAPGGTAQALVRRLWAEHAARVRAIETRIDRIMSPASRG